MSQNQTYTIKSFGLSNLLTVAFIVLKLCKVIAWSWWWVLSPLWIIWGIFGLIILVCIIIAVLKEVF